MKKILAAILALILVSLACEKTTTYSPGGTGTGELKVLFADNFSDPRSGWDRFQNENGVTNYSNIGYLIYVKTPNIIKWANPSRKLPENVRIEVDAVRSEGPDNNAFGVICRYKGTANFYYFYISSDGYAGIGRKASGSYRIISSPDGQLKPVSGVNKGNSSNHLRADCIDNTLTLYVNGNRVAQATDSTFTAGDVGLITRSYDGGGVGVRFTNFYIYRPAIPSTKR